jgi:hypothetical protein
MKVIDLNLRIKQNAEYLKQLESTIEILETFNDQLGNLAMELAVRGKWSEWNKNLKVGQVSLITNEALSNTEDENIDQIINLRDHLYELANCLRKNNNIELEMEKIYTTTENPNEARFSLGQLGYNNLIIIGVNPSYATDIISDKIITTVKTFAENGNSDGWIMLNLYPQRTTNPTLLHEFLDKKLHKQNLQEIDNILKKIKHQPLIWAAWGTLITSRPYFKQCLKDIFKITAKYNPLWINYDKVTKDGHPKHPPIFAYDVKKYKFDVLTYIDKLK